MYIIVLTWHFVPDSRLFLFDCKKIIILFLVSVPLLSPIGFFPSLSFLELQTTRRWPVALARELRVWSVSISFLIPLEIKINYNTSTENNGGKWGVIKKIVNGTNTRMFAFVLAGGENYPLFFVFCLSVSARHHAHICMSLSAHMHFLKRCSVPCVRTASICLS
jgi:hypothetical protein